MCFFWMDMKKCPLGPTYPCQNKGINNGWKMTLFLSQFFFWPRILDQHNNFKFFLEANRFALIDESKKNADVHQKRFLRVITGNVCWFQKKDFFLTNLIKFIDCFFFNFEDWIFSAKKKNTDKTKVNRSIIWTVSGFWNLHLAIRKHLCWTMAKWTKTWTWSWITWKMDLSWRMDPRSTRSIW